MNIGGPLLEQAVASGEFPGPPEAGGQIIARAGIASQTSFNNITNDPSRILDYRSSSAETADLVIGKKQDEQTPDSAQIKWINVDTINLLVRTRISPHESENGECEDSNRQSNRNGSYQHTRPRTFPKTR